MPRPTAAQLAYGSATVICSTLVMLLLSRTQSGVGVAVIAIAGLGLGVLVSLTFPIRRGARAVHTRTARMPYMTARPAAARTAVSAQVAPVSAESVPHQRAHAASSSEARVSEHSG